MQLRCPPTLPAIGLSPHQKEHLSLFPRKPMAVSLPLTPSALHACSKSYKVTSPTFDLPDNLYFLISQPSIPMPCKCTLLLCLKISPAVALHVAVSAALKP